MLCVPSHFNCWMFQFPATSEVPRANAWLSKLLLLPKLEPKVHVNLRPLKLHTIAHCTYTSSSQFRAYHGMCITVYHCVSLCITVQYHSGIKFASALLCSFCKVAPYGTCDVLVQMTMFEVHREPRSGDRMYLQIRE